MDKVEDDETIIKAFELDMYNDDNDDKDNIYSNSFIYDVYKHNIKTLNSVPRYNPIIYDENDKKNNTNIGYDAIKIRDRTYSKLNLKLDARDKMDDMVVKSILYEYDYYTDKTEEDIIEQDIKIIYGINNKMIISSVILKQKLQFAQSLEDIYITEKEDPLNKLFNIINIFEENEATYKAILKKTCNNNKHEKIAENFFMLQTVSLDKYFQALVYEFNNATKEGIHVESCKQYMDNVEVLLKKKVPQRDGVYHDAYFISQANDTKNSEIYNLYKSAYFEVSTDNENTFEHEKKLICLGQIMIPAGTNDIITLFDNENENLHYYNALAEDRMKDTTQSLMHNFIKVNNTIVKTTKSESASGPASGPASKEAEEAAKEAEEAAKEAEEAAVKNTSTSYEDLYGNINCKLPLKKSSGQIPAKGGATECKEDTSDLVIKDRCVTEYGYKVLGIIEHDKLKYKEHEKNILNFIKLYSTIIDDTIRINIIKQINNILSTAAEMDKIFLFNKKNPNYYDISKYSNVYNFVPSSDENKQDYFLHNFEYDRKTQDDNKKINKNTIASSGNVFDNGFVLVDDDPALDYKEMLLKKLKSIRQEYSSIKKIQNILIGQLALWNMNYNMFIFPITTYCPTIFCCYLYTYLRNNNIELTAMEITCLRDFNNILQKGYCNSSYSENFSQIRHNVKIQKKESIVNMIHSFFIKVANSIELQNRINIVIEKINSLSNTSDNETLKKATHVLFTEVIKESGYKNIDNIDISVITEIINENPDILINKKISIIDCKLPLYKQETQQQETQQQETLSLTTSKDNTEKSTGGGHHYFNPISRKRKMRSRSKTMKSR